MAEKKKYNSILVSGRKDETLTYSKYVKDEESGESVKESLDKKVNVTDELTTQQIKDGAITNEKIKDKNVTNEKLADNSVSNEKIKDKSITNSKLGNNSVDGRNLSNSSVENRHIANNAVSTSKIASRSVTTEKIAQNSVSRAELTPDVRSSIDKKADSEQVNNSLYDLEKKIGERFVVEGDVTNLPDEEDLTSVKESERDVLKLADRSYAPYNFSGKGYKILRKNIEQVSLAVTEIVVSSVPTSDGYLVFIINGVESHVDVVASTDTTTDKVAEKIATKLKNTLSEYDVSKSASTITLTRKFGGKVSTPSSFSAVNTGASCSITDSTKKELRNILTPVMINQSNTIYEIRYDFDLNGTLLVDRNIEFVDNGGSILNGKIKVKRGCVLTLPNETLINPLYIDGKIEFKNKPVLNDNLEVAISWFTKRRDLFVNNAYKIGIRKFNLCSTIWADLQNGEYVLSCDPNKHESEFVLDIDTYLNYIEDRVLDITEIKLHQSFPEGFFRSNEQIYVNLRNKYISYVKECIDKICKRKGLGIKRLSVFNEQAYLSDWWKSDAEVIIAKNMISEITEYGESKGILISISYAGPELFVTRYVPDNVTNFEPTVNSYPQVSFCGLNSTPVSSMFEREESVNNFDRIKYISEIGIPSREKSLASPTSWSNIGDYDYTGTIQYVFWSSVLNSQFIQKLEHVSMWYTETWQPNDITKIKALINKYKYGK